MFDFGMLRQRTVRIRTTDGARVSGAYRMILHDWSESKPTMWVSDWCQDHYVTLDRIASLETR